MSGAFVTEPWVAILVNRPGVLSNPTCVSSGNTGALFSTVSSTPNSSEPPANFPTAVRQMELFIVPRTSCGRAARPCVRASAVSLAT